MFYFGGNDNWYERDIGMNEILKLKNISFSIMK